MKYPFRCVLVLALVLLMGCRVNNSKDNPEKLKKILVSYFEAIENKDFDKMKAVTTSDFVLYEMGRVWNNDSVLDNIKRNLPFTVKYRFDNLKVYVDNRSGDITYFNHADFTFDDTAEQSFDWIESATFRKDTEGWKMNFLHLTERK